MIDNWGLRVPKPPSEGTQTRAPFELPRSCAQITSNPKSLPHIFESLRFVKNISAPGILGGNLMGKADRNLRYCQSVCEKSSVFINTYMSIKILSPISPHGGDKEGDTIAFSLRDLKGRTLSKREFVFC